MIHESLKPGQIVWRIWQEYDEIRPERVLIVNPIGPVVRFIEAPVNEQEDIEWDGLLFDRYDECLWSINLRVMSC